MLTHVYSELQGTQRLFPHIAKIVCFHMTSRHKLILYVAMLVEWSSNMAASDSKLNVNSEAEKVIIHEIPLSEHAKSLEYRLWCISND
jgi:hypothetical protein